MTSTDLHPDDLLDREMRGELSPGEQERLQAHLRECAVCRLERLTRDDFRGEAEDPAADVDARRLVAALLVPTAMLEERRPARSRMRHLRLALVAAATVSVAGLAAAARWSGAPWTPSAVTASSATAQKPPRSLEHAARAARVVPSRDLDPAPALPAPANAEPAPSPPALPPTPPRVVLARRPAVLADSTPPRPRPRREAAPDLETSVVPPPDAAALFGRGNDARRLGDHARAAHYYRALLEDYPSSSEGHEALAVLGRMLLDDSDAEGALRCFEQYLRLGGALREDVMLGRALCLRRLGRVGDETRAWEDLVAQYPSSVHAERARRRLLDLERQ
jgi:tetratricopeptide (TPR) repeat protein